jgi:hypothetical protein
MDGKKSSRTECFFNFSPSLCLLSFSVPPSTSPSQSKAEEDPKDKPLSLLIRANAFQSMAYAWPASIETRLRYTKEYVTLLRTSLLRNTWNVRLEILRALRIVMERMERDEQMTLDQELVDALLTVLFETLSDNKFGMIRQSTVEVIAALVKATEGKRDVSVSGMTTLTRFSLLLSNKNKRHFIVGFTSIGAVEQTECCHCRRSNTGEQDQSDKGDAR